MKQKILLLGLCIIISGICAFASDEISETKVFAEHQNQTCDCNKQTKCLDLMTSMYKRRATLYNVLNLSNDQQKCKDVIIKNATKN